MRVIIQGAVCDISEATAIAVLYPDYAWCDTLEQARKQQQQDKQAEADLWSIEDYDVLAMFSSRFTECVLGGFHAKNLSEEKSLKFSLGSLP